ncbi:MAG: 16S rRNA (uracil(1498)-N(3))-methyltransferase [Bacteroidota bacterium]|nr:16S rRNA (uracil(1498)-N(3))-methyltransferase [Bacteroidota bacterium]
MQIFYTPDISGMEYFLSEDESKHAIRVLRMALGDPIYMVDGKGNFYEAVIADAHPKRCKILVTNVKPNFEKWNYHLHIAISPLKNADRFEWFLEKATEMGIDEITPLHCDRTEKKNVNPERCNRIIESAMKQSIKAFHPVLNPLTKVTDLVERAGDEVKLIACCEGEREFIRNCYKPGQKVMILIGPEGDFTEEEVSLAKNTGFIPITLGESRLRTETAGIAACHSISFLNL